MLVANSTPPLPLQSWTKPLDGYLKCNVDCTLIQAKSRYGVGICFSDNPGGKRQLGFHLLVLYLNVKLLLFLFLCKWQPLVDMRVSLLRVIAKPLSTLCCVD
ncbi:hypothetical protein A2U01_0050005 [Trifolium medium]|uniref:RNA-directed DNA polymerase (Reverse transcriptase) n=1 Tax=Trifolium medium TaxID=97028 RepID=A0A392QWS2_9FABA|nr:hypothetical protein [Trifolium medium]